MIPASIRKSCIVDVGSNGTRGDCSIKGSAILAPWGQVRPNSLPFVLIGVLRLPLLLLCFLYPFGSDSCGAGDGRAFTKVPGKAEP